MNMRGHGVQTKTEGGETRGGWLMLAALVLCAGAVYLGGITKNLPYAAEMDEAFIVERAAWMATEGQLNPGWFGNPASTQIYPLVMLFRLLYGTNAAQYLTTNLTALYLPGRILSVVYALGSVVLVYLCGRRLFGALAAFAGAWLYLYCLLAVQHFQMVRSDSAAAFFTWASLYQICRLYDRPTVRNALLSGVLIGLGIASRYFGVTLLAPLALVLWLRTRPTAGTRAALGAMALGGLAALLTFAATTPYFFLDFPAARASLLLEARSTHLGADGLTPPQNVLFYLFTALPGAITWPQTIAAAAGIALAIRRRHTLALVLVATALVFIAAISLSALHWPRWIIPVLPVFSLFAGYALVESIGRILSSAAHRAAATALAVLVIAAVPMYETVLHTLRESRPSTRVLAREWILAHVPPGSIVMQEWYGALLGHTPLEVREKHSLADRPGPCSYYDEGAGYLVASSNMYDRYYREPERYAAEIAFYEQLRDPAYALHEIAPSRTTGGPTVRIYDLRACGTVR